MINPHYYLSLLIATSVIPLNADWDWADVATAGLIGAGVGACVYAATRPASPHTVKRNAEYAYDTISHANKSIISLSRSHRIHAFHDLLDQIAFHGKMVYPDYWYITSRYKSSECRDCLTWLCSLAQRL